jgi:3-dehydroquinate dehydratase-2
MKLIIINGPNLNLLGVREPDIYGSRTFEDYYAELKQRFIQVDLAYYQSNIEGEIVNKIQEVGFSYNGIILNAGAYSHTSYAIADAITSVQTSVVEVHISNTFAREEFRHKDVLTSKCAGLICGLGLEGYALAIDWFLQEEHRVP